MFERFAKDARRTVVLAQQSARGRADGHVGTEHLLLALAVDPQTGPLLARHGADPQRLATALDERRRRAGVDAEALADLGIDLGEVLDRVADTFGPDALSGTRAAGRAAAGRSPGHIPFGDDAKRTLQFALRAAVGRGDRALGSHHLLAAVLRVPGATAADLLRDVGATPDDVLFELAHLAA